MKRVALMLALGLTLFAQAPRVKRASLAAIEKSCDDRLVRLLENRFLLVGNTRAAYVGGFGAVLSAEINLFEGPGLSPFHPAISKEDVRRVHTRKMERLPALRQNMQDMLLAAAASLDEVPANDRIALGITLLAFSYEDTSGMPSQIVMQGHRGRLVEVKLGRAQAGEVITSQDF